MQILTILGKSDATVAMVLDIVERDNSLEEVDIVNNLDLPIVHSFENPRFKCNIVDSIRDTSSLFALGVTKPQVKKAVIKFFYEQGVKWFNLKWYNLVHPTACISITSSLGIGCMVGPLSVISVHTKLGDFVTVNRGVTIGHHSVLKDYVTGNPGCNIAGNVSIGEGTIVGIGANIIDNIKIGENCVIGAGSVVTKDLPDNVVAYGVPCKIIRKNEA